MRRTLALWAAAALLAACGSGSGSGDFIRTTSPPGDSTARPTTVAQRTEPTTATTVVRTPAPTTPATTAAPTTTEAPTTTAAPTTTIGECVLEAPLLAERLIEVPGYSYADYDVEYVAEGIAEINDTAAALDMFTSMSRHLVTTEDHHLLGTLELFALRDRATKAEDVSALLLDMYTPGAFDERTKAVGDIPIVWSIGGEFDIWVWVHNGVAYTFWWNGFEGNEAHGADFTRAFASTLQDLPIPPATATGAEPGPGLDVEDESLAARLVPVDGYYYEDPELAWSNDFYAAFTEATPLERASFHVVVSEEQMACGGDYADVAMLQLWELKDAYKGDPDVLEQLTTMLSIEDEGAVSSSTEIDVYGQTVTYDVAVDTDGNTQGVFLWEHDGVVYAIYTFPGCLDDSECTELVAKYVGGLIVSTLG